MENHRRYGQQCRVRLATSDKDIRPEKLWIIFGQLRPHPFTKHLCTAGTRFVYRKPELRLYVPKWRSAYAVSSKKKRAEGAFPARRDFSDAYVFLEVYTN